MPLPSWTARGTRPVFVLASGAASVVLGVGLYHAASASSQTGPLIVSVTTSPNPYAIDGNTSVTKSVGLLGYGTATTDVALEGYATAAGSTGLEGFAQSTSGATSNGVYGYSANGSGVYGVGTSASYPAAFGDNLAAGVVAGGTGVFGIGNTYGVVGEGPGTGVAGTTKSSSSGLSTAGVYGNDLSTAGLNYGVEGQSVTGDGVFGASIDGSGVTGQTSAGTQGSVAGVLGMDGSSGGSGVGVEGSTSNGDGVYGVSGSGYGVSSSDFGVVGETQNPGGGGINPTGGAAGVYGIDDTTKNYRNAGVYGTTYEGNGVLGYATGPLGRGIEGYGSAYGSLGGYMVVADSGIALEAVGEDAGSTAAMIESDSGGMLIEGMGASGSILSVDGKGNMILAGTLTQSGTPLSVARDAQGAGRVVYSPQQTEATLEDVGQGRLAGGRAYVALDPAYASTLANENYLVFLTPEGPSNVLYVTNKSLHGFEVRETAGQASIPFDYRIVGRPHATAPQPRLALYHEPAIPATIRSIIERERTFAARPPVGARLAPKAVVRPLAHRSRLPAVIVPKIPARPPVIRP